MTITFRLDGLKKTTINFLFWLSFACVIYFVNWYQFEFNPNFKPNFEEVKELVNLKQFVLLVVTGFVLYGFISFIFRKARTEDENSRRGRYLKLALAEWSSVFTNFGSALAVSGIFVGDFTYWINAVICYLMANFIFVD